MFAQNILAVLRALSRIGAKRIKPKWNTVIDTVSHVMLEALLDTTLFDACEALARPRPSIPLKS